MKKRYCDECQSVIEKGEDYYKVCFLEHKENHQTLNHAGDLCKSCWGLRTKK